MKYLKPVFKGLRYPLKRLKIFLKQKAGWLDVPKILPYNGYGNQNEVFIMGMVIEDKGLTKPEEQQKFWHNVLATIKRFSGDEISGVVVEATFNGQTHKTETDELGFFSFHFQSKGESTFSSEENWVPVDFRLMDEIIENQPEIKAKGYIHVIPEGENRIIVSDIDDTVMVSNATQILKKLRLMLFKNALTRKSFTGIAPFYKGLARGRKHLPSHPFFYVSSSEWNLYDLLDDFFRFNDLPQGIFLLRKLEYSIYKFWKSGGGSHEHKYEKIKSLLEFFPNRSFILIGDSGQQDPHIYSRLALEFPGRIESIFIRKIRTRTFLNGEENLEEKLAGVHTGYYEIKNSHEAALIARRKGYIDSTYFTEIEPKLS